MENKLEKESVAVEEKNKELTENDLEDVAGGVGGGRAPALGGIHPH
jgi:hypothetical protein